MEFRQKTDAKPLHIEVFYNYGKYRSNYFIRNTAFVLQQMCACKYLIGQMLKIWTHRMKICKGNCLIQYNCCIIFSGQQWQHWVHCCWVGERGRDPAPSLILEETFLVIHHIFYYFIPAWRCFFLFIGCYEDCLPAGEFSAFFLSLIEPLSDWNV